MKQFKMRFSVVEMPWSFGVLDLWTRFSPSVCVGTPEMAIFLKVDEDGAIDVLSGEFVEFDQSISVSIVNFSGVEML